MSKVYVITMGDYDNYHVEAVSTDKEAAERFCAVCSDTNRDIPMIEEYDILDETVDKHEKVYKALFFTMFDNGRIHSVYMRYSMKPFVLDICKNRTKDYRGFPVDIKGISGYIPVDESVDDYETAKKIVRDYVTKWKAEQA